MFKKEVSGLDKSIKFTVSPLVNQDEINIKEETGVIGKPSFADGVFTYDLSIGKAQKIIIIIGSHEEIIDITSSSGIK